jgi:hypothetical protein
MIYSESGEREAESETLTEGNKMAKPTKSYRDLRVYQLAFEAAMQIPKPQKRKYGSILQSEPDTSTKSNTPHCAMNTTTSAGCSRR